MICKNCSLKDQLEIFDLDIGDLDEPPNMKIVGYGEEEKFYCSGCKNLLEPKTMYFLDEEYVVECKELIAKKIGEILSKQIEFCSHCKGEQLEHYKYVALREDLGSDVGGIDVSDFMSENNVLDEYSDLVIDKLVCSHCNYGDGELNTDNYPMGGHFESSDCFYSETELDKFWGVDKEQISDLALEYGIDFNDNEIKDFIEYLYLKPMLALKSDTAIKLYSLLEKVFEAKNYEIMPVNEKYYRGRSRGKDCNKFADTELSYPPPGTANHGRYNAIGLAVLYCANDIKGIPYEIEPKKNQVVDIVELCCESELKLFNIDSVFQGFSEYTSSQNIESTNLKKNYLFTNFISESCCEIGYDGISYCSAGILTYRNMAFFKKSVQLLTFNNVETMEYGIHYKLQNRRIEMGGNAKWKLKI